MITARRTCVLALLLALHAAAAGLGERIDGLIDASAAARSAFWGIQIVDLGSGETLYQRNQDSYFVPASNTKLFTTAMALTRLGPDFTFQTRVLADHRPDAEGTVRGSLRLVGGGDPNLSPRALPYSMTTGTQAPEGNPLEAIDALAAQVAARGVKRVTGDIIGDDTCYLWEPYGVGWGLMDPDGEDGAPISALTVNDNAITLTVRPGAIEGQPAVLAWRPAIEYYHIVNHVQTIVTGGQRRIHFARLPGSTEARIWGTIPLRDPGQDLLLAVDDPARFAAMALRAALVKRGITVTGRARARHLYPDEVADPTIAPPQPPMQGVVMARRTSAPLIQDLQVTDKVSQNLHAEMALRAVAQARRNIGSFEAGLEELKAFLSDAGLDPDSYRFYDGSGLSRNNLVTPAGVVKLLRYMYASPLRDKWVSLLPVGGQDGTLSTRFRNDDAAAGRVHAKTGSLAHVSALSGYIQRKDESWVVFSILVNDFATPAADVHSVMDKICDAVVE